MYYSKLGRGIDEYFGILCMAYSEFIAIT